jgi:predicted RNA-binding protein associated with RNAse of E/G family
VSKVTVRVKRLPDEVDEWEHELLLDTPEMIVSEFIFSGLPKPSELEGRIITENGYRGILFEFVNEWYEIIKIWNHDGDLVGYYCNINEPPVMFDGGYEVIDLFLDLWVYPDLEYFILDEDELLDAYERNWIDIDQKEKAREVLAGLVAMVKSGRFPPRIVDEYD